MAQSEKGNPESAHRIAKAILDVPYADPDRDEAIVARRFLRLVSALENVLPNVAQLLDGWHQDGTKWSEWDEKVRQQLSQIIAIWCFKEDSNGG